MTEDRKLRLERALSALFRFQQEGGSEQEFLARHPDLRDLLEPMLAAEAAVETDPAAPTAGLPALSPGQIVAGYRLVREVGRGGVGVVYEAWHQTLERRVALKVLMPHRMQSATAVGRFLREGRTLARLDHPGIVRVLDLGCEQGLHWLAMEFVDGQSLDRWLDQRRAHGDADAATLRTAVDIVAQVAAALQHAHDHGIVHRDIKPANILLREDATAVVTDFGLARGEELLTLTQPGVTAGTPYYMAPEQIRGGPLDARADVFALGVTLFEAVTLGRPFSGGTTEAVLQSILRDEPPDPRRLNALVSSELVAIVGMALEKDCLRRYPDAGALAQDLRAYLDFRPVRARPPSPFTRLRRWMAREPLRAALALALLVAIPAVAGLSGYLAALRPELEAGRTALQETEFERLLAEGYHRHTALQSEQACAAFDRALALRNDSAEAMVGAALARQRRDGPAAALRFLDGLAASTGLPEDAARVRALVLRRLERTADAEQLERSLGPPLGPIAILLSAIALQDQQGDLAEVLRLSSLAVRVSPRPRATVWLQWASYAVAAKDPTAMAESAEVVTRLWPELWLAWQVAGAAWQNVDPQRAVAAQRKAIQLGADDAQASTNLAIYLAKAGDEAGALAELRAAVARRPEDVPLRFQLLSRLVGMERVDEAAPVFDEIIKRDPRHVRALEQMGQACYVQRADQEAIGYFRRALDVAPQDAQLWTNYGVTLRAAGDLPGALDAQQRSMALDGAQPATHDRLVQILRELGDVDPMLAEHERWARLRPDDAEAWLGLSEAQLDAGVELPRVAATAHRAVVLSRGRNGAALAHRALVHERLGELESAVLSWREAMALVEGEGAQARRARARIETELRRLAPGADATASQPARR